MRRRSHFVGYAQSGLKSGATMVTAQFLPITGAAVDLTSIVPVGDELSDNVAIQTLDAFGRTVNNYIWNDWMYDNACWTDASDDSEVTAGTVIFNPGQGLWVFGSTSGQSVQFAGKVGTADISVQLQNGATGTGNPFPVSLDLADIVPVGDNLSDNVAIQTLDAFGRTVNNYIWNDWMYDNACWTDGSDDSEIVTGDVSFEPGRGLWVFGSSDSQYLQFPAPEL